MKSGKLRTFTLNELKDKYVGKPGTPERDAYEYELQMEVLGKMIREVRRRRNLTQEELGRRVGVGKAQISKLERSAGDARMSTIIRVFKALNAKINFNAKLEDSFVELSS